MQTFTTDSSTTNDPTLYPTLLPSSSSSNPTHHPYASLFPTIRPSKEHDGTLISDSSQPTTESSKSSTAPTSNTYSASVEPDEDLVKMIVFVLGVIFGCCIMLVYGYRLVYKKSNVRKKIDEFMSMVVSSFVMMDNRANPNQVNEKKNIVIINKAHNKDKEKKLCDDGNVQIHHNDKMIEKGEDDDVNIDTKSSLDITIEGIREERNENQKNIVTDTTTTTGRDSHSGSV